MKIQKKLTGIIFIFGTLVLISLSLIYRSVSRKPRSCGRGPRRAGFATSDTIQEINLNYRKAPPCPVNGIFVRRGASLLQKPLCNPDRVNRGNERNS